MNKAKRKIIEVCIDQLSEIMDILENEICDEDEKRENMLSASQIEISENASENMQSAIDSINEAVVYLETAIEC